MNDVAVWLVVLMVTTSHCFSGVEVHRFPMPNWNTCVAVLKETVSSPDADNAFVATCVSANQSYMLTDTRASWWEAPHPAWWEPKDPVIIAKEEAKTAAADAVRAAEKAVAAANDAARAVAPPPTPQPPPSPVTTAP